MANRDPDQGGPGQPAGRGHVAIVGGGPVGLGLAIELGLRGVACTVLERSQDLHHIPKGQNLTQRSGEHFRSWGVSDAVRAASPIPPSFGNAGVVCYGTLLGAHSHDWFQRSKVGAYYFAENERLPQYALERVLRDRVASLPGVRLITGAMVTAVTQDAGGVGVQFTGPDGTDRTLAADHAVGCDGARSLTRDAAGIASDTDHDGPRMALLVFRSAELHRLLERFPGKSIFNVMNPDMDGYWQFLGRVDLDGGWFFHSPVPAGTTRDNFDFSAFLHRVAGAEFALELDHVGFWDLRITQAKSYRRGRIFIAGDACHSHPPYGGYGVNTGLEDARNLGWKLAAHMHGWAGPGLLDSYGAERHPVFQSVNRDFIARMIADFRDFTARYAPDRDAGAFRAAWARRASGGNADVTGFLPHYAGSPIVTGSGPRAHPGARGVHGFAARPGQHLAPQALSKGSLWQALGAGYTLMDLTGDRDRMAAFTAAAAARSIPLTVLDLAAEALDGAYDCPALLVRPDQFVAWVAGDEPADAGAIFDRAIGA